MSAEARTAPAVAASFAAGNARSKSYSPYAASKQSRQPARTSESAEVSRSAGVGAGVGVTTTAGRLVGVHADTATRSRRQAGRPAHASRRIERFDPAGRKMARGTMGAIRTVMDIPT